MSPLKPTQNKNLTESIFGAFAQCSCRNTSPFSREGTKKIPTLAAKCTARMGHPKEHLLLCRAFARRTDECVRPHIRRLHAGAFGGVEDSEAVAALRPDQEQGVLSFGDAGEGLLDLVGA